jgi:Putative death-receptor fusion protein (DUF2428)
MRDAIDAIVALNIVPVAFWASYSANLLRTQASSVGMYAPMSRLIPSVGSRAILENLPAAQDQVLTVFAADSNAAKPVSDWLEVLWRGLLLDEGMNALAIAATGPIVTVLVNKCSAPVRERAAAYVVPAFLRACVGYEKEAVHALISAAADLDLDAEDRVRTSIVVLSAVRRTEASHVHDMSDPLLVTQLRTAFRNHDPDVRITALELVASCRSTTVPILQEELDLVLEALPMCLFPGAPRCDGNRFQKAMVKFLERVTDSWNAAGVSGGWWNKERRLKYDGNRPPEFEVKRIKYLEMVADFRVRLSAQLIASCHPGGAPDRRRGALEILSLAALSDGVNRALSIKIAADGSDEHADTRGLPQKGVIVSIIRCVMDEWAPSASAALALSCLVPAFMSGLSDTAYANAVIDEILPFIRSPRATEAEPGSNLMRLIYRKAVIESGSVVTYGNVSQIVTGCSNASAIVHFFDLLLAQIEQRVSKASIDLSSVCKSGLFYGDIRVLRNCVQDTDWAATCSIEDVGLPGVRNLAQRILSVLLSCASVARQGLDLQANGFVDETIETPKDILTRDLAQKVGTSCHLSVREVCHALAMVAQHMSVVHKARCGANVVMSESVALDGEMLVVLETDDMQRLGDLFDTLLQSARHNGVIKGASDGFELVCSQLLQSSLDRMRMLPLLWVGSALSNAINGEMYALRRSAGIPYHILGVIRAEAMIARRRGEQPTILCLVFDLLLNHLSDAGFAIDLSSALAGATSGKTLHFQSRGAEGAVVHCLNVLRFVFLDTTVSRNVPRYLACCLMVSLQGFQSGSWLVRNSAFMLFAALVRRGIGSPQENKSPTSASSFEASSGTSATMDGSRRVQGVTATQFFSRNPEMHPFLLAELELCVGTDADTSTLSTSASQQALFPVLYLLSSLSPSIDSDQNDEFSMTRFAESLTRCLGSRDDYVRRVAASACVPLVKGSMSVAADVEDALMTRLSLEGPAFSAGQNRVHGEVLRLAAILKGMHSVMTLDDKVATVIVLVRWLPERAWIADNEFQNSSPVPRSVMLRVLSRATKLAVHVHSAIRSSALSGSCESKLLSCMLAATRTLLLLCSKVARKCLDVTLSANEPGTPVMRRAAAKLTCVVHRSVASLQANDEKFVDVLTVAELMLHSVPEVREVAVKHGSSEFSLFAPAVSIILDEQSFAILNGALKLARSCLGEACDEKRDKVVITSLMRSCTRSEKLWPQVVSLVRHSTCLDVRESGLELVGQLIGATSTGAVGSTQFEEWLDLVDVACSDAQIGTSRVAACRSIEYSSVLRASNLSRSQPQYGRALARAQIALVRLLQDENNDVRRAAMQAVQQIDSKTGENQCLDALPALFAVHESMSKDEPTTLAYLESKLALYSEVVDVVRDPGLLHMMFDTECGQEGAYEPLCLLHVANGLPLPSTHEDFNVHRHDSVNSEEDNREDVSEDADEKLFKDDAENLCDEPDVLLQLAVWAIRRISQMHAALLSSDPCKQATLNFLLIQWTIDAAVTLRHHYGAPLERLLCAGHLTDKSLFRLVHLKLARIFAAVALLSPGIGAPATCSGELRAAICHGHVAANMHPALYRCADNLVNVLATDDPVSQQSACDSAILFLIK